MRKTLDSLSQLLLWTLRDFLREPVTLFWTLGFPILMTLTLGQITSQGHQLRANVAVLADSPAERAQAEAWLPGAPEADRMQWTLMAPADLPKAMAMGAVRLGVERPWAPARVWHLDPANTQALLVYHELRDALEHRPADTQPMTIPGGRYIDFLLPGLLALGLVNTTLWAVGLNLVELREKRLLRLMLATPLSPAVFFASLYVGRLLLAGLEVLILIVFCHLLFGLQVQGSYAALAALAMAGSTAFFGLAVLVGSRTDRSSVGQGLINAVTLPMFAISGVFFSLDNFPPGLQKVFRAFPPTLLVDAMRSVVNGGGGWAEVAGPIAALLAMGALCYGLGRRIFRFY